LSSPCQSLEGRVTDFTPEVVSDQDDFEGCLGLQRVFPVVDQREDLIDKGLQEQLTGGFAVQPFGRFLKTGQKLLFPLRDDLLFRDSQSPGHFDVTPDGFTVAAGGSSDRANRLFVAPTTKNRPDFHGLHPFECHSS
jgi:hypothetical protein